MQDARGYENLGCTRVYCVRSACLAGAHACGSTTLPKRRRSGRRGEIHTTDLNQRAAPELSNGQLRPMAARLLQSVLLVVALAACGACLPLDFAEGLTLGTSQSSNDGEAQAAGSRAPSVSAAV